MIPSALALTRMSDHDLVSAATHLAGEGREATADLIALLVVLEERTQAYADEGYSSLFRFCVGHLRLSEEEAYYRIAAARVVERFPAVLERLRAGTITLTAVAVLRKHLTAENHVGLLEAAEGRSKREVQQLVAALSPRPDVPSSVRLLPAARAAAAPVVPIADDGARAVASTVSAASSASVGAAHPPGSAPPVSRADGSACAPSGTAGLPELESAGRPARSQLPVLAAPRHAEVQPLAPTRYSLHVTISEETYGKLQQATDLLRHTLPEGDPAAIIDRALTLLVAHLQRVKFAATTPRPRATKQPARRAQRPRTPRQRVERPGLAPSTDGAFRAEIAPPPPGPSEVLGLTAKASASRTRARYIPAAVRRAVWQRDAGACAFVSSSGRRCTETGGLEFHHKVPFAEGGEASEANLEVRCKLHNAREAVRWFGDEVRTYRGGNDADGRAGEPPNSGRTKNRAAGRPSPSSR